MNEKPLSLVTRTLTASFDASFTFRLFLIALDTMCKKESLPWFQGALTFTRLFRQA